MAVSLTPLTPDLASAYAAVVRENWRHLSLPESEAFRTDASFAQELGDPGERNSRFAVMLDSTLVGRIDLNPVDPPKYAVGYWIALAHNGHGLASAAVALVVQHAREELGATDLYGGVTKGNPASVAVLLGNGFTMTADLGTYERFHLPLDGGRPRNP